MATTPIVGGQGGVAVAAGTAATSDVTLTDVAGRSLVVVLSTTTASGGNTVQVTINAVTASGYTYPLVTGVAVATVATTLYRIGPGLTAVANLTVSDVLPRKIQIVSTVVGTVAYGIDYFVGV
jgi:hypothetical protein